jgi:hypothetical protein
MTELALFGAGFDNPGMDANPPMPRRWFRFSLRTMFVLVTMLCVWLEYHLNWIRERRELLSSLPSEREPSANTEFRYETCFTRLPLSLKVLGEHPHDNLTIYFSDSRKPLTEAQLERIRGLFPESYIQSQIQ